MQPLCQIPERIDREVSAGLPPEFGDAAAALLPRRQPRDHDVPDRIPDRGPAAQPPPPRLRRRHYLTFAEGCSMNENAAADLARRAGHDRRAALPLGRSRGTRMGPGVGPGRWPGDPCRGRSWPPDSPRRRSRSWFSAPCRSLSSPGGALPHPCWRFSPWCWAERRSEMSTNEPLCQMKHDLRLVVQCRAAAGVTARTPCPHRRVLLCGGRGQMPGPDGPGRSPRTRNGRTEAGCAVSRWSRYGITAGGVLVCALLEPAGNHPGRAAGRTGCGRKPVRPPGVDPGRLDRRIGDRRGRPPCQPAPG